MRLYEFGTGKIVPGVNTTADVGVDEIKKQAKKFGNNVDRDGNPPVNPGGKIKISEAVDYKWDYENAASFKVNNMNYLINFIPTRGKDRQYEVEFSAGGFGPRFSNNNAMGSSSIQVFSTVINAIREFINRENPELLHFSGEKADNRVDLYNKLVNRFAQQIKDAGYSVKILDSNTKTDFIIQKNEIKETVIKLGKTKPDDDSPAQLMINEFKSITDQHPFSLMLRSHDNAMANLYGLSNTTVRLGDIQGSGQGSGSKMLKLITDLADKYQVTIKLDAYGYEDKIPTDELVKWYQRNGFDIVNVDEDVVAMIRHPH